MKVKSFDDVDRALDDVRGQIKKADILDGHQLDDVELTTTSVRVLHKLGRRLQGYMLVRCDAGVTVWQGQPADAVNLYLQASAPVTVSLWVY